MVDTTDIAESIKTLVAHELKIDKKLVTDQASLTDLGADSLDMVEIIMALEEKYGIEISDEEAEKIKNINDAVQLIMSKEK